MDCFGFCVPLVRTVLFEREVRYAHTALADLPACVMTTDSFAVTGHEPQGNVGKTFRMNAVYLCGFQPNRGCDVGKNQWVFGSSYRKSTVEI